MEIWVEVGVKVSLEIWYQKVYSSLLTWSLSIMITDTRFYKCTGLFKLYLLTRRERGRRITDGRDRPGVDITGETWVLDTSWVFVVCWTVDMF